MDRIKSQSSNLALSRLNTTRFNPCKMADWRLQNIFRASQSTGSDSFMLWFVFLAWILGHSILPLKVQLLIPPSWYNPNQKVSNWNLLYNGKSFFLLLCYFRKILAYHMKYSAIENAITKYDCSWVLLSSWRE